MARLYRSVYEGDDKGEAWHGSALKPLLEGITPTEASRSTAGMHSILQLVQHLAYWEEVMLRRLQGEIVDAPLNSLQDWPANHQASDGEWQNMKERLEKSHAALRNAMESCTEAKLRQQVPGREFDNYVLLHGIIDHCVYHTAQIALLKSAKRR